MRYRVILKAECEMLVEVDAGSAFDAKRKARDGDYDPCNQWEPVSYSKLRAVEARTVEESDS